MKRLLTLIFVLVVLFFTINVQAEILGFDNSALLNKMQTQVTGEYLGNSLHVLLVVSCDSSKQREDLLVITADYSGDTLYIGEISKDGLIYLIDGEQHSSRQNFRLWRMDGLYDSTSFVRSGVHRILNLKILGANGMMSNGQIQLDYLYNAYVDLRYTTTFTFFCEQKELLPRWRVVADESTLGLPVGSEIVRLHLEINKIFSQEVGIKNILFNEAADRRRRSL